MVLCRIRIKTRKRSNQMNVKSKLSILFLTLLLTACAAEEAAPIEEGGRGGVTEEELQQEESVDEVESNEVTFESAQKVYLSPLLEGVEAESYDIDSLETDTSEISGFYRSSTPVIMDEDFEYPTEEWVEVNDDGTYTRIKYIVFDVSVDEEGFYKDKNFESYRDMFSPAEFYEMGYLSHTDEPSQLLYTGGSNALYLNSNNEIQVKEGDNITVGDIVVESGYLAAEYGEVRYVPVDSIEVTGKYDSEGEILISDLFNETFNDVESTNIAVKDVKVSEEPFVISDFSNDNPDSFPISEWLQDGKLKSANQIQADLNIKNSERTENETELHKENDATYYFNNNEFFLYHAHMSTMNKFYVITDTEHLVGYTQDNTEIVPDIAIEYGNGIYTLTDEGLMLKFDDSNNTWNP